MTDNIISCGLLLNFFLYYFLRQTLWRKIFPGDGSTVAEASTGPRSKCQLSPTFASLARKMCFAEMEVVGLQYRPEIQSFMLVFPTLLVN